MQHLHTYCAHARTHTDIYIHSHTQRLTADKQQSVMKTFQVGETSEITREKYAYDGHDYLYIRIH